MDGFCRSRFHSLPQGIFNLLACTSCFTYLFPTNTELQQKGPILQATNNSRYRAGILIYTDVTNSTFVNKICNTLKKDGDCGRWTDCCHAAIKCCKEQLQTPVLYNGTTYCPRIWDGFGCFGDTLPGIRETIQCPSYIEHGVTHGKLHYFLFSSHNWLHLQWSLSKRDTWCRWVFRLDWLMLQKY
jgi:hypothetical protein